jgi:hypothetical protein
MGRKTGNGRTRLAVVDRASWGRAVRWLYERRDCKWEEFEQRTEVSQATLFRLRDRESVDAQTYDRLVAYLSKLADADPDPPTRRLPSAVLKNTEAYVARAKAQHVLLDLTSAIEPRGVRLVLRGYADWLAERKARFFARAAPRFDMPGMQTFDAPEWDRAVRNGESPYSISELGGPVTPRAWHRWDRYKLFRGDLRKRCPEADRKLEELYSHASERFSQDRALIAVLSVVEPLLEYGECSFVERRFTELEPDDLIKFVRAGVARERILLEREPDRARAQSIDEADPWII